jgi:hypothetical protein
LEIRKMCTRFMVPLDSEVNHQRLERLLP